MQFISTKVVDFSNPALSGFDYNWQWRSLVIREARSGLSLIFQSVVYFCCLHIAINQLSSSRSCLTRLYFESVSRYHDNIKSSKDAFCMTVWVCCPPTLKARSNFECSFNVSSRVDCFHFAVQLLARGTLIWPNWTQQILPSLTITLASHPVSFQC